MIRKIIFLFLVTTSVLTAQSDMSKGFGLLEQGNFQEAELFFGEYLKEDPNNKTAKLCYGRAVGLSGEPKKATILFSELLKEYPGDFEILINYNESFLWAKEY